MGFAGTTKGSFFEAPEWVDMSKPPGTTSQAKVYGQRDWWLVYPTLRYFFYSPNLVWFLIAFTIYLVFPYDMEAAKTWQVEWVARRAIINVTLVLVYFGFWNLCTYAWGWTFRKFRDDSTPTLSRMFHNVFYSVIGTLQWTAWECIFVYCYATGRLTYVPDSQMFSTPLETLKTFAWILFVPLWRDFHFYFAHRLLHIRVLYKYVHSLHHRNTDIEPFSGLCMHPIEHLYYFACVGPSLYIHASPLIMMWNGMHLLLSPAASHSGWEDHFQCDQFHYLHHAYFECNYGVSGPPMDKWFGTFRERIGKSDKYVGAAEAIADEIDPAKVQKKAKRPEYLRGGLSLKSAFPPSFPYFLYHLFTISCAAVLVCGIFNFYGVGNWSLFGIDSARIVAFYVAYGPIVFGLLLLLVTKDRYSPIYPFHKESFFGVLGWHVVLGWLLCIVPVFDLVATLLA